MKEWDAVEWWVSADAQRLMFEERLRALAAEAERRGMLKAAGVCRGGRFLHADAPDAKWARDCAAAIERAAKGEG